MPICKYLYVCVCMYAFMFKCMSVSNFTLLTWLYMWNFNIYAFIEAWNQQLSGKKSVFYTIFYYYFIFFLFFRNTSRWMNGWLADSMTLSLTVSKYLIIFVFFAWLCGNIKSALDCGDYYYKMLLLKLFS